MKVAPGSLVVCVAYCTRLSTWVYGSRHFASGDVTVQALCELLEAMAMLDSRSGQMGFSCHQQGSICEWGGQRHAIVDLEG